MIQSLTVMVLFIKEWGSNGTGEGEINIIHGLDVDSSDKVYAIDTKYIFPGNDHIQKFHSNGTFSPGPEEAYILRLDGLWAVDTFK